MQTDKDLGYDRTLKAKEDIQGHHGPKTIDGNVLAQGGWKLQIPRCGYIMETERTGEIG